MYDYPDVPEKQWAVVVGQLASLHRGEPSPFDIVGTALLWLRVLTDTRAVLLLDAGCSTGYYREVIWHYVGSWVNYIGIDDSRHMVEFARHKYPGIAVFNQDIAYIAFEDEEFDIVLTGATVNHVPEWGEAVRELARVCKKWLLFHRLPLIAGRTRYEDAEAYGHEGSAVFFNEDEFGEVVREQGFRLIYEMPYEDLRAQIWERI